MSFKKIDISFFFDSDKNRLESIFKKLLQMALRFIIMCESVRDGMKRSRYDI